MTCWHCNCELNLNYQSDDFSFKFYHCDVCDAWYEMRKEEAKNNGAVPIRFDELQTAPKLPLAA